MVDKRVKKVAVCPICGKSFEVQHNSQVYCDKECYKIAHKEQDKQNRYRKNKPPRRKQAKYPFNIYVNHLK